MAFASVRYMIAGCVLLVLLRSGALGANLDAADSANAFFEKRVRPVLVARCFKCHGSDSKAKGGLRVDSRAALVRGGDRGPALKPGKPEESLLIHALHHDGEVKMPPRSKLSPREIADLTTWIKTGAAWPDEQPIIQLPHTEARVEFTPEQQVFWAFQPPRLPAIPRVRDTGWVRSPIDALILAQLEASGLRPMPPADKRTLLRRATFDLIGLPPTPQEIEEFVRDDAPDAFAKVIDRLLASPHYGERWGRHWLDVARYADSNGMDENLVQANAWRYRDYVIAAFNRDKPYDCFVREQLAGDLLPAADAQTAAEQIIATGFLSLGPKMLAEDDPVKMQMDIVDEQIDTVGRTFLGLTLGCARCHDHKFDPLPTADYYSLAGIFKSTKTMDNFRVVARWHERSLGTSEEIARQQDQQKRIDAKRREIDKAGKRSKENQEQLKRLREELRELEKTRVELPAAMAVEEGSIGNVRIHLRGSHWTLGREVPRRFPQILADNRQAPLNSKQSGRRQLAEWLTRRDHPLTGRVMVNRIWHWHFGRGMVKTTDNFGRLGERPVNQPLLDWLTLRFIEGGWSIKALHRQIMLSNTYQMSASLDAEAARVDPENRLRWRWDRRRLEAEEVRDALLAVNGQLDPALGGSLLQGNNRAYVPGYPNSRYDRYDSRRRSVYLPVLRSDLYPVFQAFDFADPSAPSGERATTTVAPQALFMLNSKLVREQTRSLAADLLRREDDSGRMRWLYEYSLGRPPTSAEIARALAFVGRAEQLLSGEKIHAGERRLRAWQALCQVIVASNEFIYVE